MSGEVKSYGRRYCVSLWTSTESCDEGCVEVFFRGEWVWQLVEVVQWM